ncbi:hypothetical protein FOZ61_006913 [Perkinsus olseni]|uniref:Uncharacterized protein n=1 Tax=Perkinsus olseni TaxID=32597 RepID=A0A7J6LBD0_PEROL|nr:hypothetical protein FOZ61_006913 [Perkinsus olseni]
MGSAVASKLSFSRSREDPDVARKVVYGSPPECGVEYAKALAAQVEEDGMVGSIGLLVEELSRPGPRQRSPPPPPLALMDGQEEEEDGDSPAAATTTLALANEEATKMEENAMVLSPLTPASPANPHDDSVRAKDRLAAAYELQLSPYSKAVRQLELVNYVEQATGDTFHSFEIIAAAEKLQVDAVRALLEAGADPNSLGPAVRVALDTRGGYTQSPIKGSSQVTALHVAAAVRKNRGDRVKDLIDTLVEYKADVMKVTPTNAETPLHLACYFGNAKAVKALLSHVGRKKIRGYVNLRSSWGHTALTLAASRGHGEVCELLLRNEADPTARVPSEGDRSAAEIALVSGFKKLSAKLGNAQPLPPIAVDVYSNVRRPSAKAAVEAAGGSQTDPDALWVKLEQPKSPTGMIWYNKLSGNYHVAENN